MTYIAAVVSDRVTRPSLRLSFYEYGKREQERKRDVAVLVTTKYSLDPFVATKREPAARSWTERGGTLILKAISKEWSRSGGVRIQGFPKLLL